VSSTASDITRLELSAGLTGRIADKVSFGNPRQYVPEPGSLPLSTAALAGWMLARRRRKH
jgi:hypothetical protein